MNKTIMPLVGSFFLSCSLLAGGVSVFAADKEKSIGTVKVTNSEGIYIRTGPGKTYKKTGTLEQGDEVKVYEKTGTWYETKSGKWITAKEQYIDFIEPDKLEKIGTVTVNAEAINARNGPGKEYSVIKTIEQGKSFSVYKQKGTWYYKGKGEWVTAKPEFVDFEKVPANDEKTSDSSVPDPAPAPAPEKPSFPPLQVSVSAEPTNAPLTIRDSVRFQAHASGGSGTYTDVKWDSYQGGSTQLDTLGEPVSYPDGTQTIQATVCDAQQPTVCETASQTIQVSYPALQATLSPNSALTGDLFEDDGFAFKVEATGGSGVYKTTWTNYENGKGANQGSGAKKNFLAGVQKVGVTVCDATYPTKPCVSQSVNFTVLPKTNKFSIKVDHVYNPALPMEYYAFHIIPKNDQVAATLAKKGSGFDQEIAKPKRETVSSFATRKGAVLAFNASGWMKDDTVTGLQIKNGKVIKEADPFHKYSACMNGAGTLSIQTSPKAASDLVKNGVVNCWAFGIPLFENGAPSSDALLQSSAGWTERHPRTILAQMKNSKEILVVIVDGKNSRSRGVTAKEAVDILKKYPVGNAIMLDGGGSSQVWYENKVYNRPSDGKERPVPDFLYFSYN